MGIDFAIKIPIIWEEPPTVSQWLCHSSHVSKDEEDFNEKCLLLEDIRSKRVRMCEVKQESKARLQDEKRPYRRDEVRLFVIRLGTALRSCI